MTAPPQTHSLDGPWFDDLTVGDVFADAPGLTLTDGHAAVHQAIVGDRMRLALDAALSRAVVGSERVLAHPALVWDVAIGHSTTVTGRVIANLFYRGLAFRRAVLIGDTLRTRTEIAALRQTSRRPGVPNRGLALLHVTTRDQDDRVVLDFHRCAMLPLRDPDGDTGAADEIAGPEPGAGDAVDLAICTRGWQLAPLRAAAPHGPGFQDLTPGMIWRADGGDVVSAAPELSRLTVNIATAHHDALRPGGDGRRLVYGGHTIALAAARISRALPTLATIPAWHRCDHVGPVFEDDTLYTEIELQRLEPRPGDGGGGVAHLRARVAAAGEDRRRRDVLDWELAAVIA